MYFHSVKPSLKKVSKYDGKLEKMAKIAAKAEMDFRNNLKRVQSTKFTMEEDAKEVSTFAGVLNCPHNWGQQCPLFSPKSQI